MNCRLFSLLIAVILYSSAQAQQCIIKGNILSENQEPLAGVSILLEGTKHSTSTDHEGFFFLSNLQPGRYVLVASGTGYSARSQQIEVMAGKTVHTSFQLNPVSKWLEPVVVRSKQRTITTVSSSLTRTATDIRDLPQHVQVIDHNTLQEQQVFSVDQALKNVAGVNVATSYGAINMRGFTTQAGSFLTNGLKGQPYPEGVAPLLGNIESVEVLHGPSAILFGQGSVGGNVNLVTKQPKKESSVKASVGAGSFGLLRVIADVTGSLNKRKSLYFLAGVAYQDGGRFTDRFNNSNLQLYGSVKWDIAAKTKLQVNANYNRDRSTSNWMPEVPVLEGIRLFSLPRAFSFYGRDASYKGNSYQFQANLEQVFNKTWKANVLAGATQSNADRKSYNLTWDYDQATTALGRSLTMSTVISPTFTINPFLTGAFQWGKVTSTVIAGADITLNRSRYPNGFKYYTADSLYLNAPDYGDWKPVPPQTWSSRVEKFTYNTTGFYVQDQLGLTDKLKLLLGIRLNRYFMRFLSQDENLDPIYDERPEITTSFTPRAGLVYQAFTHSSFYADYNQGFIPQYSNERKFGGPFDPEIANQFEVGYKGDFLQNKLHATVAGYHINKKNVLVYYEDENLPDGYGYRPLQKVTSKGVEISVSGNIAKGLFVVANYSYNDTRIAESNEATEVGQTFYNAPRNTAGGWLSYSFLQKWNIGFGMNYIDRRTTYFGSIPGYTTADAVIGYRFRRFGLQVNGNNLFDKTYAQSGGYTDYTPGAPRNVMVTLTYTSR